MSDIESLKERIIRDVAELPDRTSPDDWPDAMLVTDEELSIILDRNLTTLQSRLAEAERALEQICMFGEAQEIMDEPEEFGGTDDGAETLCMVYENIQFIAGRALVTIRSAPAIREEEPLPAKQGE